MKSDKLLLLAFLTATASAVYIVESLIMGLLPVPFLRLGLSNIVLLYLVYQQRIFSAFIVAALKSIIGSVATFSLLTPILPLSLGGGLVAVAVMSLSLLMRPRFSLFGISVLGALAHNFTQLILVRYMLIRHDGLFVLTPFLILAALFSGIVTAYLCIYIEEKIPIFKAAKDEKA